MRALVLLYTKNVNKTPARELPDCATRWQNATDTRLRNLTSHLGAMQCGHVCDFSIHYHATHRSSFSEGKTLRQT